MHARLHRHRLALLAAGGLLVFGTAGCFGYGARHEIQGDSRAQIWLSEASQVRLRNAQSRVFDETEREDMLSAVVAVFQDLGFQIEVLDETLGIITGKKFLDAERPSSAAGLETYLIYDDESLVVFNRSYRTWGPFYRRSDLVRLTVTIRDRNAEQLIVRASVQHYLRPVETPRAYQQFYAALEQALLSERVMRTP
ncbi:MAG: hypothetical protein JRG86_08465 [Deltaproteobacteria bacterium]|nr:hypothetical protein [Deltaproteobacteria bacterium]MBW2497625.1 hypothetical protein [Deltaproteobacteria bacterium]